MLSVSFVVKRGMNYLFYFILFLPIENDQGTDEERGREAKLEYLLLCVSLIMFKLSLIEYAQSILKLKIFIGF